MVERCEYPCFLHELSRKFAAACTIVRVKYLHSNGEAVSPPCCPIDNGHASMPDLVGKFVIADSHGMGGVGNDKFDRAKVKLNVCLTNVV